MTKHVMSVIFRVIISFMLCISNFSICIAAYADAGATQTSPDATGYQQSGEQERLVPIWFFCKAYGAQINWNGKTKSVTIIKGSSESVFKMNEKNATINGSAILLEEKVGAVNGRTVLPVHIVNKVLNTNLTWNDCIKVIGQQYFDLLVQGQSDDSYTLLGKNLIDIVSKDRLKAISQSYRGYGNLKLDSAVTSDSPVHHNVVLKYSSVYGPLEATVRLDKEGMVDDFMLAPVQNGGEYKTPSYSSKDSFIEKDVVIGEGKWALPATLTLPAGKGPFPVVVLVHGSGPNDRDETLGALKPFKDIAEVLASKKIAVLRYEKRTREHSLKASLEKNFTVKEETMDDALEASKLLRNTEGINPKQIFILGHSQGGMLMPKIIDADIDGSIRGAIIMAGNSRPLEDLMVEQLEYLSSIGMATKQQADFYKQQVAIIKDNNFSVENPSKDFKLGNLKWWVSVKGYKAAEAARNQSKPMLVLQGERDYQVTAAGDFKIWKETLADRKDVVFKLYPKLNHMFGEGEGAMSTPMEYYQPSNVPEYVINDIASWIDDICKK